MKVNGYPQLFDYQLFDSFKYLLLRSIDERNLNYVNYDKFSFLGELSLKGVIMGVICPSK